MIEANHLTRRFGRTTAVSNVSFRIEDHEVVGLLGPNGAGKTTIMRMLAGYLEPTTGEITVDGELLGQNAYCIQRQLGYLPENLPVYPEMYIADYLDYVATTKGIGGETRIRAIREALAATELHDLALEPIGRLSRGQKQRVGVAQAILGRPRYLILDEPTNGLDPRQTEHMRTLIGNLSRRATVIVSTHIMQEVEAVCDRVLILRNGQLALDQSIAALRQCGELLLRTCNSSSDLDAALEALPGVAAVTAQAAEGEMQAWCLRLAEDADSETVAGQVAECVHAAGARLYRLESTSRQLETIFHEVIGEA